MAKKKKKEALSVAIVVLNVLIIGIIIMMCVLIFMYFNNGGEAETPAETTTQAAVNTTTELTTTTSVSVSMTKVSTEPIVVSTPVESETSVTTETTTVPATYNKSYYANDLFIGDSISTGLTAYGYLEMENVFAKIGLNPETAMTTDVDGVMISDKISALQPRNTYIMLGSNGLAYMGNDYMVNRMLELIAEIETACPTTKIVIISIPPVTKAHDAEGNETMELVNDYNARLKKLANDGGFEYIDLCSYFKDSEGYFSSEYAEQDGLHFLGAAYIAMLNYIEECLGA